MNRAPLPLTPLHLRGLFKACLIESQKNAGFLARVEHDQDEGRSLSRSGCMLALCLLKGGSLIRLSTGPQSKDDPDPDIGKCSDGDGMTFAFGSFALIIVCGPRLAQSGLPGKLMQRIAQGFDAAKASMGLGIPAALKQDGRGSPQRLQAAGILIAQAIISDFGQQSWSQVLACARQALKDLVVRMGQKKGLNLLVVLGNLLDEWLQLGQQGQQQARFGAGCDRIGLQVGLFESLTNLLGHLLGLRMSGLLEDGRELLQRSRGGGLRRGIGSQKLHRRPLLQLAKQRKRHRIVGFEAGGELIDQPGLHLDQRPHGHG
jgi:hypothetical protein